MGVLTRISILLALLLSTSGCSHFSYLVQAGLGELALYNHERSLEEVIADARTPEKVRERLLWVPEIKKMVEAELGIKPTSNYTTYVQLDRPYVTWALTVAEPFELKLKEWSFPFFGSFPYLGFFHEDAAKSWATDHEKLGLDAYVRGVSAFSTLGYLRDPLLSSMLSRSKGDMVNLVFHESTHGYIYIKSQVAFNEQIASYIGDYGERQWLARTYGEKSKEVQEWEDERVDRRRFGAMLRADAEELKKYYAGSAGLGPVERRAGKEKQFARFGQALETEKWKGRGFGRAAKLIRNNAALLAFLTYEDEQDVFDLLNKKCGGRIREALLYLKAFERVWNEVGDKKAVAPQDLLRRRLTEGGDGCRG